MLTRILSMKLNLSCDAMNLYLITKKNDNFSQKNKHENNIHEHKNSKTIKPDKCVFNLSQRLDLKRSNKHSEL